jgi:UDP-N-acetylglucosamine 2-epimerase (hydrolysing)
MRDVRRLLFITGSRADFGKLKPLLQGAQQTEGLECHVFVTGMHLDTRFGDTWREVERSAVSGVTKFVNFSGATPQNLASIVSNTISGLSNYLRNHESPNMIVVHGDRGEALAGAIVGSLNNILVGHIEGGELSGSADEMIRHAVTKLAHIHFVANDKARRLVLQMGELESCVHVIGSPDIDTMLSPGLPTLEAVKQRNMITFDCYAILIYHPVSSELPLLEAKTRNVVDAARQSHENFVVVYPNNEPGSDVIIQALSGLNDDSRFRVIPSVPFEDFLVLLRNARMIVGNSSTGIREAPAYGIPTINIGSRQSNRFSTPSILNVSEDTPSILAALRSPPLACERSFHFGDGKSTERFISVLSREATWSTPLQKQLQHI